MKHFFEKYKKAIVIPGVGVVALILYFTLFHQTDEAAYSLIEPVSITEQTNPTALEEPIKEVMESEANQKVIVDVKGAVNYPGVFELTTNNRIVDAIELAGGYAANADPTRINHAQKLVDEMVIYIPIVGEEIPEMESVQVANTTINKSSSSENGKVNLNTATESELTTLPGIGPSKAQAILTYREENGSFQSIDDLKKVSGIGEKTFEKLKDLIEV